MYILIIIIIIIIIINKIYIAHLYKSSKALYNNAKKILNNSLLFTIKPILKIDLKTRQCTLIKSLTKKVRLKITLKII